jgi:DNA-directed RNA polymerase specialized sigma24 family protein
MRVEAREAAYVEFVTARQTHLRRLAYALCGDWRQADDLLQAALVRLYVAWPRVWRLGTEESYARRLIIRARVDERRGLRRRGSEATDADDRTALFAALQSLPEAQRKAVVLRHWLGLSLEEAAEELGTPQGTVRGLAERGLAVLESAPAREER